MTFNQWINEYRKLGGLTKGQTTMLREDYDAGYTPAQSLEYNRRGYGPNMLGMAANLTKWLGLVS